MINKWFHRTELDKEYYQEFIDGKLPDIILDAHVHMNLMEHVKEVSAERIKMDWALECGLHMDYEASEHYYTTMFPGQKVLLGAFPFPLFEVDIAANNSYLGELGAQGKILPVMSVRPEWSAEYCEKVLLAQNFLGFKPYPYLASNIKGADISIYDFMPKAQLEILNRHKKLMILHLPRKGRLPAEGNIRELREIRQEYPDITIILAHYGRCFTGEVFQNGMKSLGEDRNGFYFDTAAVINPEVHKMAMEMLDYRKILFGTDFPIMTWHGIREWKTDTPTNYCREDFSWNQHERRGEEQGFTYIAYVQIKNMLDAIGTNENIKNHIFYKNAANLFMKNSTNSI